VVQIIGNFAFEGVLVVLGGVFGVEIADTVPDIFQKDEGHPFFLVDGAQLLEEVGDGQALLLYLVQAAVRVVTFFRP